jgi:hypothetical protein
MVTRKQDRQARIHKVRQWLKAQLIQDVPEDIAACEFECRKIECRQGDWETCENRLRGMRRNKGSAT